MTELDPLSRALLSAAAGCHEPSQADRARVRRRLIARLGIAAGVGALGSAATQTSPAMAATAGGAVGESALSGTLLGSAKLFAIGKVVGMTVAVSAAGLGGYEWVASTSGTNAPTAAVAGAARAVPAKAKAPVAIRSARPAPVSSALTDSEDQSMKRAAPPPPASRPVERAINGTVTAQPVQADNAKALADSPALPPIASFPPDAPNLAAEARGLAHAQAALREGNAAQALSLLDQQKSQFAGGSLEEERSAARVFALCKVGNVQAANVAAAEFLRRSPHSVLAERVANACPTRK